MAESGDGEDCCAVSANSGPIRYRGGGVEFAGPENGGPKKNIEGLENDGTVDKLASAMQFWLSVNSSANSTRHA